MGYAIAEELAYRGAKVTLVSGPVSVSTHAKGLKLMPVQSASEMYDACSANLDYDIAVMAAAVADYTPTEVKAQKIKKSDEETVLELTRTKDILSMLGQKKKESQVLVGFALETEHEKENALKKLQSKGADMIALNSLNEKGAGFGGDTNKITLLYKNGTEKTFELKPKGEVAKDIVDSITELIK
jgi:phosphopantothenoylcysteine decarboxylase/phosphopantothenate--cysteine ligase